MDENITKLIKELAEYTENGDIQWEVKDGMMVCGNISMKKNEPFYTIGGVLPVCVTEEEVIPLLVAMVRAELMWKKTPDMDSVMKYSAYNPPIACESITDSNPTNRSAGW